VTINFEKIYETCCAGDGGASSVQSVAPEHSINIVNGDKEKKLTENTSNDELYEMAYDLHDDGMSKEDAIKYISEEMPWLDRAGIEEAVNDTYTDDYGYPDSYLSMRESKLKEEFGDDPYGYGEGTNGYCPECGKELSFPGITNRRACSWCGWEEPLDDDIDHTSDPDMDGIEDDDYIFERGQFANDLEESVKDRIELRKKLNESLFDAIENKRLKEELEDEKSPANLVRYQLQKWTNGGTIKDDGTIDGEKDGPSSYEAWRAGINDKKRKARTEQENADRNSPFASPKTTKMPEKMLDGQEDEFLYDWINKRKPNEKVKENLSNRIDNFLNGIN